MCVFYYLCFWWYYTLKCQNICSVIYSYSFNFEKKLQIVEKEFCVSSYITAKGAIALYRVSHNSHHHDLTPPHTASMCLQNQPPLLPDPTPWPAK